MSVDKDKYLAVVQVAQFGMYFVEKYGYYYDRDWGRVRCHSCGHADGGTGEGREHIIHAEDCEMVATENLWAELNKDDGCIEDDSEN